MTMGQNVDERNIIWLRTYDAQSPSSRVDTHQNGTVHETRKTHVRVAEHIGPHRQTRAHGNAPRGPESRPRKKGMRRREI
jgi:hypothetical protein